MDGDKTLDFTLPQRPDSYGYFCLVQPAAYVEATNVLPLSGDDAATEVTLPFPFTLYGTTYATAHVATNGFLNFLAPDASFTNGPIPSASTPNAAIYPYWDDLIVDGEASVRTELLGSAPNRRFVVEWRNVAFFGDSSRRVDFEAVLFENGHVLTQYRNVAEDAREKGDSATVGIENDTGTIALQYSFNEPMIGHPDFAVLYRLPPSGSVVGRVTDANDGLPLAGANVRALQDGGVVRETTTDADGRYRVQLPLGTYAVEASAQSYSTESARVVLDTEDEVVTQDFALRAARVQVSPAALEFLVPPGQTRTRTLTLTNTGTLDLRWEAGEVPVAAGTNAGKVKTPGPGVDSRTPEAGYAPKPTRTVLQGGPTLIFMDALPWGTDALTQVLNANGIPYDTATSSQMGTIDLSRYEVVFLSNDQPPDFYASYASNRARFEDYVLAGGFLWAGAAAWGFNGGDFNGGVLPGGATVQGPVLEERNDVVDNAHPTMQGVPDPFSGTFASHAAFQNLPAGANVIARGQNSGLPTLVEYALGAGRVLAFGQTLEYGWQFGQDPGRILENGVPYAYAFQPVIDIPWLSEAPSGGTLAPGASQAVAVTVDTTGLQPGLYRARILISSNDPRNPRLQVPVTLVVPAYYQGVNAGGGDYTDRAGDLWSADRQYVAGSFGYTNPMSRLAMTSRPISGTDDDPLYQTQRVDPTEYRFDGLPAGVYQVELRFAEVTRRAPSTRLLDVIVEGSTVLPAHDVAAEVGSFAADDHTLFLPVTDGQLNIRFVGRRDTRPRS